MAGTKIEEAINNVATVVEKSDVQGSLGIKGMLWNNVGNMAAMAIIAGAFLYLGQDFIKQSKEDRVMFREELKAIRQSADASRDKTEAVHTKAMEKMGMTVERAVTSMEKAVDELKETTKAIKPFGSRPPG